MQLPAGLFATTDLRRPAFGRGRPTSGDGRYPGRHAPPTPLLIAAAAAGLVAATVYVRQGSTREPAATEGGVSVWFSPCGGCEAAVVEQIAAAKTSVDVRAYSFTSHAIGQALVDATGWGVRVRAILDPKAAWEDRREPDLVAAHRVVTYTDAEHPIAHDKIVVVDDGVVVTGSFNFIGQAETSNAENLVAIRGRPAIAAAYAEDFERHLKHSRPYRAAEWGWRRWCGPAS